MTGAAEDEVVGEEGATGTLRAEVDLLFDGDVIQTRAVELPLDSSTMVNFAPEVLERERTTRGTVRLREDALDTDNEFHFVLSPAHEVGVLVIEPGGDRRRGRYLEEALSLGRRPFLRVNRVQASGFQPTMLEGKSVLVINDAAQQLPSAAVAAVVRFVREGGGLLLGVERGLNSTSALLGEFGVESSQQVDRLAGTPGSLAWFDTGHPVFDVFAAARSGDFSSASFFRYHRLETPEGAVAIALFDDGSPALLDLLPAVSEDDVTGAVNGQGRASPGVAHVVRHVLEHSACPGGVPALHASFGAVPGGLFVAPFVVPGRRGRLCRVAGIGGRRGRGIHFGRSVRQRAPPRHRWK